MSDLPPLTPRDLDAARARSISRGTQIRNRNRAGVAACGVVAVALLLLGGVALAGAGAGGDGDDAVETVDEPGTTTTTARTRRTTTTTTTTATTLGSTTTSIATTGDPPPDSSVPLEGEDVPPPTTPAPEAPAPTCVTVTGDGAPARADWASFWQTEPAYNDPLTLQVCVADVTVAVGEGAELTVSVSDPDGLTAVDYPNRQGCNGPYDCFLSIDTDVSWARRPPQQGTPLEPQPTPAEAPSSASRTVSVPMGGPGTYDLVVLAQSTHRSVVQVDEPCAGCSPGPAWLVSPYQSTAEAVITITVA